MKKTTTSVIVLLILAAAIAVLAYLNRPAEIPDSGTVLVTCGEMTKSFTMEEIKALPYIEVEKEVVSSSFANDEGLFRGPALRTILTSAGINPDDQRQCVVHSEDGFIAAYPMEEVMESDNIFLAYSKNEEGLGTKENGGTGPFRIIVTEDEFGNRCAKYVCELEIK